MVENHGCIFLLQPLTSFAQEWIAENIPAKALKWAGATVVEHEFIRDVLIGIQEAGGGVRMMSTVGTENVGTAFRLGLCAAGVVVLGLALPLWAVALVVLPLAVLGECCAGELARCGELKALFAIMQQGMARPASACRWPSTPLRLGTSTIPVPKSSGIARKRPVSVASPWSERERRLPLNHAGSGALWARCESSLYTQVAAGSSPAPPMLWFARSRNPLARIPIAEDP